MSDDNELMKLKIELDTANTKLAKLEQFLSLVDTDSGLKHSETPSLILGYANCIRDLKEWLKGE